ncbi:hypothetical protein F5Y16DRAFT_285185 [Xylariaceae sp. FL0255]|nr:hypothetical protein F5Y16DRAFT_285185 [Xylariaceae sp. FL0255]
MTKSRVSAPKIKPIVSFSKTQLYLLESIIHICTLLANGAAFREVQSVVDGKAVLSMVKLGVNYSAMKLFFSSDLLAVEATWAGLLELAKDFRDQDAVKILIEIGFKAHGSLWVTRNATILVESSVLTGISEFETFSTRIFSTELVSSASKYKICWLLSNVASNLDTKTMIALTQAGARFDRSLSTVLGLENTICNTQDTRRDCSTEDFQTWVSLLIMAGFHLDFTCRHGYIQDKSGNWRYRYLVACWNKLLNWDPDTEPPSENQNDYSFLDWIWVYGSPKAYEVLDLHSRWTTKHATIPGIVLAARRGTEALRLYLASKEPQQGSEDLNSMLEVSLSVGALLGDTATIRNLALLGVDPNTPRLPFEHCALISAVMESHIDAVEVILDIGASTNQVERYIITHQRDVAPTVLEYLAHKGLFHASNLSSLITALKDSPIRKDVAAMIIEADVPSSTLCDGINLIQIAIREGWGLDAIKFLHTRGITIHSLPNPEKRQYNAP